MMELKENGLVYVSAHNRASDPGVERKVRDFCAAAGNLGFEASLICEYTRSVKARRQLLEQMLQTDAKYVVLRSFNAFNIRCRRLLKEVRRQGRVLVLDQPTPLSSVLHEIWERHNPFWKKILSTLRLLRNGPWGQRVFDRIVQYGDESWFFSLGNRGRTILMGNGIDVSRMELRRTDYTDSGPLRLVGVAAKFSPGHGFDRVLRAMEKLRGRVDVEFELVGEDDASSIADLADSLGVADKVHFHGLRDSAYIWDLYSRCNLAVSSLAPFRKGLKTAAVLKAREYCLAGIPFIACGADPDFGSDVPFRLTVPNDDSIEPVVAVLKDFDTYRSKFTDSQIREYAISHLSYEAKIKQMLEGLG